MRGPTNEVWPGVREGKRDGLMGREKEIGGWDERKRDGWMGRMRERREGSEGRRDEKE